MVLRSGLRCLGVRQGSISWFLSNVARNLFHVAGSPGCCVSMFLFLFLLGSGVRRSPQVEIETPDRTCRYSTSSDRCYSRLEYARTCPDALDSAGFRHVILRPFWSKSHSLNDVALQNKLASSIECPRTKWDDFGEMARKLAKPDSPSLAIFAHGLYTCESVVGVENFDVLNPALPPP